LTLNHLPISIDKNSGGLKMTKVERTPSFGNLSEWLEGFEYESSPQMHRGMLEALFYKYNFLDSKGLNANNQLLYIIRALSFKNVTDKTVEFGGNLALGKILWRRPFEKWPRGVKKDTLFQFLRFIEKRCHKKNVDPIHLRRDYLENFLESMVNAYGPTSNTRTENSLIIRMIFAQGEVGMFACCSSWFGSRLIISELLKRFPKDSNPFTSDGWDKYHTALAIHLARAGELDEVVSRLTNR
jgi:hypothetical protein